MNYADSLWLFLLLIAGIIIVPGMDMLYVLANGLTGGRRAGMTATAGMVAGGAVHTLYGTIGTGLLAALAPKLFLPLLVAGALYMAWIGYTLARSSITVDAVEGASPVRLSTIFRRAVLTCLMNPKAYLFVIAVYPQFLRPEYGPFWRQGLVLGLITALMQASVYGAIALAAGRARGLLIGNPVATVWVGRSVGLLLILVAFVTAAEGLLGPAAAS
ncbi:LysE family translocator [Pseudomonas sp. R2.Fl]|nr:LysE family translocator [Pseudomonas sp. R2.Fl]